MCESCKCETGENREAASFRTLILALETSESRTQRIYERCYDLPAVQGIELLEEVTHLQTLLRSIKKDLERRNPDG